MISTFSDLLDMATSQDQPQRLLFLFAQAEGLNSKKIQQKEKQSTERHHFTGDVRR